MFLISLFLHLLKFQLLNGQKSGEIHLKKFTKLSLKVLKIAITETFRCSLQMNQLDLHSHSREKSVAHDSSPRSNASEHSSLVSACMRSSLRRTQSSSDDSWVMPFCFKCIGVMRWGSLLILLSFSWMTPTWWLLLNVSEFITKLTRHWPEGSLVRDHLVEVHPVFGLLSVE